MYKFILAIAVSFIATSAHAELPEYLCYAVKDLAPYRPALGDGIQELRLKWAFKSNSPVGASSGLIAIRQSAGAPNQVAALGVCETNPGTPGECDLYEDAGGFTIINSENARYLNGDQAVMLPKVVTIRVAERVETETMRPENISRVKLHEQLTRYIDIELTKVHNSNCIVSY
ncbi:MAG: hypothetical protein HRT45_13095 [Bdellovibrionales bacterium]|nr:hypothetical protein [Bdellovibrionales bacterium]